MKKPNVPYPSPAISSTPDMTSRPRAPQKPKGKGTSPYTAAPIRGLAPPDIASPLRVIHVGQSLVRVGGIETALRGLIRFLDPNRVQLVRCLVTHDDNFDPEVAADLGVPVQLGGADAVRQAAREADVLLCWGPHQLGDWLADTRPPLCVFVAHGEGYWTRWILEGCAGILDHVIAVSDRVSRAVCADLPCTVIPNGVDTAHVAPTRGRREARAAWGFEPGHFVLGYVGRFSAEKRPERVLQAVARLPHRYRALMAGAGPLRADLLDLANQLIPGRFSFVTAAGDVGNVYEALDALCLPSEEEGFGLVILEAMFRERPVIATRVGCVPDAIIDRVSGLVVDGSPASIARAARLLRRHPAWARGLAVEGRAYAEEHGHARDMARRYEQLILDLWRRKHGENGEPDTLPAP